MISRSSVSTTLAVRAAVIVAGIGLAALTLQTGVATATAGRNGAVAIAWSPGHAGAQTRRADELVQPGASRADLERAKKLATAVVRRDPTATVAFRTLGIIADMQGDRPRAKRLLAYADALSRRDLGTQLWLIEEAVDRSDVPGALHYFDVALRTSKRASPILFPILISATEDRRLLAPIADLLRPEQNWGNWYLGALVDTGKATENIETLLGMLRQGDRPVPLEVYRRFAARLILERKFDAARRVYDHAPGLDSADLLRNGGFEFDAPAIAFEWAYVSESDRAAERLSPGAGGSTHALHFRSSDDGGGKVAEQLLVLPAGRYRVTGVVGDHEAIGAGSAFWSIACVAEDDAALVEAPLPEGDADGAPFAFDLSVPATGCEAQWFRLNLRADPNGDAMSGWVDDLAIRAVDGT